MVDIPSGDAPVPADEPASPEGQNKIASIISQVALGGRAKIGRGSIVAVGAIVLEEMNVPPGSVVMGTPAVVKREMTERDTARICHAAEHYVKAAQAFRAGQMA